MPPGDRKPGFFGGYDTRRFFVCWWYGNCAQSDQRKQQMVWLSGGAGPEMVRILVRIGSRNVPLLGGAFADRAVISSAMSWIPPHDLPRVPSAAAGFRRPGGGVGQAVEAVGRLVAFGGH